MTLVLVFLFSALTLWALYRIVAPFMESPREQLRFEMLDEELGQIEQLVARKSVLLQTLRDIEFDHNTGKLSDEDYERLRKKHEIRAVRVMRDLERLRSSGDVDEEIDRELAERLRNRVEQRPDAVPGQLDANAVAGDDFGAGPPTRECPACARQLAPDARFCDGCGTELQTADRADDHAEEPTNHALRSEPAT